ncbi:MAG: hypothetical protein KME22_09215 [Hassallia sp. WJT32-NPBG1]|nr:hypothetical protein [Hassallia sp. WJT32-NPBG1]
MATEINALITGCFFIPLAAVAEIEAIASVGFRRGLIAKSSRQYRH